MMKMKHWLMAMTAGLVLGSGVMAAEDFSAYSTEELQQKRSEARNMSEADRAAYRSEMQTRMGAMSDEERAQMRQGGGAGGQGESRYRSNEEMGQGTTTRERSMDGSATGGQYGGGGFNAEDDLPSLGGDAPATRYGSGKGQGDGSGRGQGKGAGNGQGGGGRQMGR
jgi:hypothetical protein